MWHRVASHRRGFSESAFASNARYAVEAGNDQAKGIHSRHACPGHQKGATTLFPTIDPHGQWTTPSSDTSRLTWDIQSTPPTLNPGSSLTFGFGFIPLQKNPALKKAIQGEGQQRYVGKDGKFGVSFMVSLDGKNTRYRLVRH